MKVKSCPVQLLKEAVNRFADTVHIHQAEFVVEGEAVQAGQVIGSVGRSATCEADRGWHLHFELRREGEPVDFSALVP